MSTFINKVITYEQSGTPNWSRALLLGEYLGDSSYVGTRNQGGMALEYMVLPHLGAYAVTFLDDRPEHYSVWTKAQCIAQLNASPHLVAHVGHGNRTVLLRSDRTIGTSDVAALTNEHPFLLNSVACLSGSFDYEDCLAEHFVKQSSRGAFATVMNTRDGWYDVNFPWLYSGEFQGKFFNRLLTQGFRNIGAAAQLSKEDMLGKVEMGGSMPYRWCYYTIALLGDPETALKEATTTRTLTVKSFDSTPATASYFGGVTIGVSPGTPGITEFSRECADGATVTLTAPQTHGSLLFQRWRLDGVDQAIGQSSLAVTMAVDHSAVAVYTDPPLLSLVETAASQWVRPGETVTVKLNVSKLATRTINTIQALMSFDNALLTNAAITKTGVAPWSSGFEPLKVIGAGVIDYSIGIFGSTAADAEVAILTFTAGLTEGQAYVRFRADEPPKFTKLVETPVINDLLPEKQDAGMITIDGTPPEIYPQEDIVTEQTSRDGTPVTLVEPDYWDTWDSQPTLTSDAPALFPLGTTTVTWTCTDAAGNTATATQRVTVRDTTPPVLTLPGTLTREQASAAGTAVTFACTAADLCDAAPAVVATPASGSTFPLGTTKVTV
ncbi:MAG TPA: C25 family cysteine peptidase, partial [Planctomycetota bacterium]|nr:C25 family cysteine peptidase [Planctomycetota bacterium]